MERVKAFDINGTEIKRGNLVKIVEAPNVEHGWLKVGNTLFVTHWEDRTLGKSPYICVFLESKRGRKSCRLGVQDNRLEVVKG